MSDRVIFHKKPVRSSRLVLEPHWGRAKSANLMICHAREASRGDPSDNRNNHPFVSKSMNLGVVHNGRIPEEIYDRIIKDHPTESECDSEVILRMLEKPRELNLGVLQDAWRALEGSQMAVAVGERHKDVCRLWLFRNKYRSLWTVSLDSLGQTFFVSTKEIWEEASEGLTGSPEEVPPGLLLGFLLGAGPVAEYSIIQA